LAVGVTLVTSILAAGISTVLRAGGAVSTARAGGEPPSAHHRTCLNYRRVDASMHKLAKAMGNRPSIPKLVHLLKVLGRDVAVSEKHAKGPTRSYYAQMHRSIRTVLSRIKMIRSSVPRAELISVLRDVIAATGAELLTIRAYAHCARL
jgi:hypothetical protein